MQRTLLFCAFAALAACAGHSDTVPADSSAASEDELTTNDLTTDQQKLVLLLIDDRCGDSWCEGDYDFRFKKMVCAFTTKESCTMTVMAIDTADVHRYYWRSCKMTGILRWEDLVQTFPNGYQDITDPFFDKLTTCMDSIEANLPPA
jgi:hypothetical protein